MNSRSCCQCGRIQPEDCYTRLQWSYGTGLSRCKECLHGISLVDDPEGTQRIVGTARINQSSRASFPRKAIETPFASGKFRWVAMGEYTDGPREGQKCVCKWFKSGFTFEEEFFKNDIRAVDQAALIVEQFNAEGIIQQMIRLNIPAVWVFDEHTDKAGTKVMQEPYIDCWQKFNSNSGWADDELPWPKVMQALSHFSYHASGGMMVLCDLQGGVFHDGVILTDPVILSVNQSFGVTDLGPQGISTFFSRHVCNEFCRAEWQRSVDQTAYFDPEVGTSMAASESTMHTTATGASHPRPRSKPGRIPPTQMSVFRQYVPRYQEDGYHVNHNNQVMFHNQVDNPQYEGVYSDEPVTGFEPHEGYHGNEPPPEELEHIQKRHDSAPNS
mmetsp:Transcript_21573/g.36123  ORF Transcript_21573/g.36123 Transcript_21573/m.36123 type:complete len:385 (+) Transcript_21573:1-1155(+)